MLEDHEIESIVRNARQEAMEYCGKGSQLEINRAKFYERYNHEKFGDEKPGMSSVVMSNTYNTIEGMMPDLLQTFSMSDHPVIFTEKTTDYAAQAEQKTNVFTDIWQKNGGITIASNFIRDGLLTYTGWVKSYTTNKYKIDIETFKNQTDEGVEALKLDIKEKFGQNKSIDVKLAETVKNDDDTQNVTFFVIEKRKETIIENLPPEECLIDRDARSFDDAEFIGQQTPKTRSDLKKMGFDKNLVDSLAQDETSSSIVKEARDEDHNERSSDQMQYKSQKDKAQEKLWLGEFYMMIDVDEDGMSELYQIFFCDNKILRKTPVLEHPYSVFTPIPRPHRAIGSTPIEPLVKHDWWHSVTVRNMNNNMYATNHNRAVMNKTVDMDSYTTPRHGGAIEVDTMGDVRAAIMPLPVINQVPAILQSLDYIESERERMTGVTSYNQGMDQNSPNQTATGFVGTTNMSMKRIGLIKNQAKETLKNIARKSLKSLINYGEDVIQVAMNGETVEVRPEDWKLEKCSISAGIDAGDIQQKLSNLYMVLQTQERFADKSNGLSDTALIYNTLEQICLYSNLSDSSLFFNNTKVPEQMMQAELEKLSKENAALKQKSEQLEKLAMTEGEKAKASIMREQMKIESNEKIKTAEINQKSEIEGAKLEQEDFIKKQELEQKAIEATDDYEKDMVKLELEHGKELINERGPDERL